jgi:hypothetical protein
MEHGKGERLEQLLRSYGADKARWPVSERGMNAEQSDAIGAEACAIDGILSLASQPELPEGAMTRLMARIEQRPSADVILFRPRPRATGSYFRYAAALPLAASLALGIYLGAMGSLDFMLPVSLTGDLASTEDPADDLGGVGEADAYAEENLT